MYVARQTPETPLVARRALALPIRVALCLTPAGGTFNIFDMMSDVFGRWATGRATKVFSPFVYAPAMSIDAVRERLQLSPDDPRLSSRNFVKLSPLSSPRFDIVHVVSPLVTLAQRIVIPRLLRNSKTRLLILQVPTEHFERTQAYANTLAEKRGPAVLVAAADSGDTVSAYLTNVYGGVVHNLPLTRVTVTDDPDLHIFLVYGSGGENLLRLDPLLANLENRVLRLQSRHHELVAGLSKSDDKFPYLHQSHKRTVGAQRSQLLRDAYNLASDMESMRLSTLEWARESRGAIPLAEAIKSVALSERSATDITKAFEELQQRIHSEAVTAPRVLNANFADSNNMLVDPSSALTPNSQYDLLVDVGPRWDMIPSIVVGNAEFPEHALPDPTAGGFKIRVVVVSDDFSPKVVSAFLFLPAGRGRSRPLEREGGIDSSGPLRLRLRAPKAGDAQGIARLRLSLYYECNLLQSGVLSVVVGQKEDNDSRRNQLVIDYVLSGTFQNLRGAFETRDIVLPTGEGLPSRVTLNLTLNDDGGTGHRITVLTAAGLEPATLPYDTTFGNQAMADARSELLSLFFRKDSSGVVTTTPGLEKDNGKDLEQFKLDLYALARLGRRLLLAAFGNAFVEGQLSTLPIAYLKLLETTLENPAVIQVARTGPAQYVFPWALLYSHPLTGDSRLWRYCPVIEKEWVNGRRSGDPGGHCPNHKSPNDHDNTICPFGFWGLRHVIEQPLSMVRKQDGKYLLANPAKIITAGEQINVALARTNDAAAGPGIDAHLEDLGRHSALHLLPMNGATTAAEAVMAFQSPEIIYIICHGKYDDFEKQPYIGIGSNDQSYDHRIYPTTFQDWGAKSEAPNLAAWQNKRPLVIVNGCHTCYLLPGQMLNVVTALNSVGAGGVLGTEVSVQLPVAIEIASTIFGQLRTEAGESKGVGEALQRARWTLANKGNLLGLAYTAYCMADLKVVTARR